MLIRKTERGSYKLFPLKRKRKNKGSNSKTICTNITVQYIQLR